MKIRQARLADIPIMVKLGREMWDESPTYSRMTFNEEKVLRTIFMWIKNPDCLALLIETDDDEVVGGFIGGIESHYFSDDLVAYDNIWFMSKEHRGSTASLKLLQHYREWAKQKGATITMFGNSTGVMPDRVAALIERCGFEKVGYNFLEKAGA